MKRVSVINISMIDFLFSLYLETVQYIKCGVKKSGTRGQNRIINGQDAEANEWPWMASLQALKQHFCGGSVIGRRWIITAAHCLVRKDGSRLKPTSIAVTLGDHDDTEQSETDKTEVYDVDYYILHEKYRRRSITNDIAVIKVKKSIDLRLHTPVCLPRRNANFAYSKATAVGWGYDGRKNPARLQEGTLTIKAKSSCSRYRYGNFCAGGSGVGVCFGDSGGPLTVKNRQGRHILAGITSFGITNDCNVYVPSYFADVSYYRDWIKKKTGI